MNFIHFIQKSTVQKVLALFVFCFWIALFYQKIELFEKMDDRPNGEHAWAQIDRASMALTYYKDDATFWLPRCHQVDGNNEGITAGEFPLVPYSVSKMYSAWGFKEIYHRVFVLSITIVGFLFSFLLALRFIRSPFYAAIVAALWIASPNIIYYSVSFLPDTAALAFMTIAIYFLCKKDEPLRGFDLVFFSLFFSLGILIKASTLLPMGGVLFALIITKGKLKFSGWNNKLKFAMAFLIPLLISFSWIKYAHYITTKYHIFTFLMSPMPPTSWEDLLKGMNFFGSFSYYFYIEGFLYFLLAATLVGLFFIRRSNIFLFLSALFIYLAGFVLFIVLFQRAPAHFYYWVPFQLGIFFHLAWLFDLFLKTKLPQWFFVSVWIGALVFLNYNAIHIHKNVNARWGKAGDIERKYDDLEIKLESLGIHYSDRVFSYWDSSFNNTLYLMNRKGITESQMNNVDYIRTKLFLCNYAVLSDTAFFLNPEVKPYFADKLGQHNGLFIYKIKAR